MDAVHHTAPTKKMKEGVYAKLIKEIKQNAKIIIQKKTTQVQKRNKTQKGQLAHKY